MTKPNPNRVYVVLEHEPEYDEGDYGVEGGSVWVVGVYDSYEKAKQLVGKSLRYEIRESELHLG